MKAIRCSLLMAMSATSLSSLSAAVIIADSFNGTGPLHGTAVELSNNGTYTWSAQGPTVGYYRDNGVAMIGPAGATATAPVTRLATINRTLAPTERATLTLDVQLANSSNGVAWTSVSFLTAPWDHYDSAEWNSGQLTLRLMNTGEYWVLGPCHDINAQDIIAHGALAPAFFVGGWNRLSLDFNHANNIASASINGVQVMDSVNPFDITGAFPDSPAYDPGITSVGIQMYNGVNWSSSMDNFNLTIVPEPSVGWIASGMTLLGLRRRRRHQPRLI